LDQEKIAAVRTLDGNLQPRGQFARSGGMIEMAMGEKNLLQRDACFLDRLHDPVEIAARIGDGAAHGFVIPEKGAVLLERRDGENRGFETHGMALASNDGAVKLGAWSPDVQCAKNSLFSMLFPACAMGVNGKSLCVQQILCVLRKLGK